MHLADDEKFPCQPEKILQKTSGQIKNAVSTSMNARSGKKNTRCTRHGTALKPVLQHLNSK